MRKCLNAALALLVLLALPAGAFGQGWFGGLFASAGQSGPCCEPACPGALKFDLGYLFGDRGLRTGLSFKNTVFAGVNSDDFQWRVQGLQLGATFEAPLKDDFGIMLRGTWLIPDNRRANEVFNDPTGGPAGPNWSTNVQYYTVEGAGLYPVCGPCSIVGGFRFDALSTNFKNPRFNPVEVSAVSADRAEWTINEYIPYVGLGIKYGPTARVSFIGTPILWGDMKSRLTFGDTGPESQEFRATFKDGYFFEAAAEYGMNLCGGNASVLAKWTYLHATASPTAHGNEPGLPNSDVAAASLFLIRQNLLVAAQFSLPFTSPW